MKYFLSLVFLALVILLGSSLFARASDPTILTTNGLHWHTHLAITVAGKDVPIPAGIGLGVAEMPIHTHDTDGIIHMEFSGTVHTSDLALGQFFKVWGKDMSSFGTNMRMTVNGKENTDFGQYVMRDGDRVELQYD